MVHGILFPNDRERQTPQFKIFGSGMWGYLNSTNPPMTLPSWSSMLTGCPEQTCIFDFVQRDAEWELDTFQHFDVYQPFIKYYPNKMLRLLVWLFQRLGSSRQAIVIISNSILLYRY